MLTNTFFAGNRQRLRDLIPSDAVCVIAAQSLLQRSGDTTYPFRQDSNFFYLTGIDEPDVVLVMCGDEEFLILPKRSEAETIFGGEINCDEIAKISNIRSIYDQKEGWDKYNKLQQSRKTVYTVGAAPSKVLHTDSFFTNPARRNLIQKLRRLHKAIQVEDIRVQLMQLRMIKQPEEIAAIKAAIDVTKHGFDAVLRGLTEGTHERFLESIYDSEFKQRGAMHAYQPIIASGKNACMLHYIKNNQTVKSGDGVLLDVGAEVNNYSADISRTYFVGQISERKQQVYEAVVDAQQRAISLLKPGLAWKDWSLAVNQIIGEKLVALKLIQSVADQAVRQYFPHGIGHSLGLDVHDVCDYKTIQQGMVITVEPGIYIQREGIGVRIEDDVLITGSGAENLSAHIAYS